MNAPNFKNLVGQSFGRGTALTRIGRTGRNYAVWKMRCGCGNEYHAVSRDLLHGDTKSCGCLLPEITAGRSTTHGAARRGRMTREYRIWTGIKNRCRNPQNKSFPDYGGRGISLCQEWASSFESFLEDMGKAPTVRHSIGRKDNNGGYNRENCRWETETQQARNTRRTRWVTSGGQTKCLTEWAMGIGITPTALDLRLRRGWPVERALVP